jgi:hypothetical protein
MRYVVDICGGFKALSVNRVVMRCMLLIIVAPQLAHRSQITAPTFSSPV